MFSGCGSDDVTAVLADLNEETDPYPAVIAFEEQADNGKALLEAFASATVVTNDKFIASSPQYVVDIEGDKAKCKEIMTFDSTGTVTFKNLEESGTAQSLY
jgi:hypothetical protein